MAFTLPDTVDIIEIMENYIQKIRPPENIRHQLDINYKIDGQSIILFEIRPHFEIPDLILEPAYAKATYVKAEDIWKIYWMRGNLKWTLYEPKPRVKNLKEFIEIVEEDSGAVFWKRWIKSAVFCFAQSAYFFCLDIYGVNVVKSVVMRVKCDLLMNEYRS